MKHLTRIAALIALVTLNACSGEAIDYGQEGNTESAVTPADQLEEAPIQFEDDVESLAQLPDIVHSETLPETGLEVAYTTGLQRDWIDPLLVDAQWQHMLSCTGVSLDAPLVMIVEDEAMQLDDADDVIRYIDGRTVASSSRASDPAIVQVSESDFDGSLGSIGFNLRAIMGRYLWLGASLAERDYPFNCTRL